MKKIISLVIVVFILLITTGCNRNPFETNFTYHKVVCNYDGDKFELKVDNYTILAEARIKIKSDGKTYFLSTNKCYLIGD